MTLIEEHIHAEAEQRIAETERVQPSGKRLALLCRKKHQMAYARELREGSCTRGAGAVPVSYSSPPSVESETPPASEWERRK